MTQIIDRRKNTKGKSTENRKKFLNRVKGAIKEQLPHIIAKKSIKDLGNPNGGGGKIIISKNKTVSEPNFRNGPDGKKDYVLPGNKKFVPGDSLDKPPKNGSGNGRGREGSPDGIGEDDFIVELSQKEFLDYFFEDLELPNLVKKNLANINETEHKFAGFVKDGSPNKLSIIRSFKQSLARRIPIKASINARIEKLQQLLNEYNRITEVLSSEILSKDEELKFLNERNNSDEYLQLVAKISMLHENLLNVAYFDPIDLRFKQTVNVDIPTTHATMVMIMDNSGSMGLEEKTIARKFFYLLYAFLIRQYKYVDLRFISHTTEAKEMDEHEFFTTRESGGTIVSSALELASKIIKEELGNTNVYVCQVSDGDNFGNDNTHCYNLITEDILPHIQYYSYIQIDDYHSEQGSQLTLTNYLGFDKGLWETYSKIHMAYDHFQIKRVFEESDIYAVFRELFEAKIK